MSQLDKGSKVLLITQAIISASKAATCQLGITSTGLADGDSVLIESVGGMVELNGLRATITNKQTSTVDLLGVNSTGFTTYTSGGATNFIRRPLKTTSQETSRTTDGTHDLWVSLSALVRGDGLFAWLREKVEDSGAEEWHKVLIANHAQGDHRKFDWTDPSIMHHSWQYFLEQWVGDAARTVDWSIRAP